jgi:hypothetical protein
VPPLPDKPIQRGRLNRPLPPGRRIFARKHLPLSLGKRLRHPQPRQPRPPRREIVDRRMREPHPLPVPGWRTHVINQLPKPIKPNGPPVHHPNQPASNPAEKRMSSDAPLELT